MVFVLSNEEKLEKCIKALEEIKSTHDANIIMGDRVVRDRAYLQAKECLDDVMCELPDNDTLYMFCYLLNIRKI